MLKQLIERTFGQLSDSDLKEILDLVTTDIRINRIGFGKRTSPDQVVEIASICKTVLGR